MTDPTSRRLLEVALAAADAGASAALRWFREPPPVETKQDGTPVTLADRETERIVRETILAAFPAHAIVGEEHGAHAGTSPYRWFIDPIDGTKSFVRGVPLWGTLVAVERDGEPLAGVCRMPAIGETVAAAKGEGCTLNDWPCRVSDVSDLKDAVLVGTSSRLGRRRTPRFTELEDKVSFARTWGDCWAYVLVATGRADLAVDPQMSPWDNGPWTVILEEAGGRFSDWQGLRTIHGGDAVGSNGRLHDAALAVLAGR